jgi:hypothetical protein
MVLLYETLDMLLWVYGWEKHSSLRVQHPQSSVSSKLGVNLNKVIKLVNDWPSLVENIPYPDSGFQMPTLIDAGRTSDYEAALFRFCQALISDSKSKFKQVCAHIHSVGFVFRWIAYVSFCDLGTNHF